MIHVSWTYGFVVNDGKIFGLTDEVVEESFLGYEIGEVTYYSDIEGSYSGNFSNELPVGTLYFTIQGIAPEEAIAVKKDGFYVKATYGGEYSGGREKSSIQ
ncbi:hypothetical protein [Paenibacillus antarcticus]|uniref:Uncharacterized protein n=1 Tax=Paenibacillus antarcticus TaxID=253703 RepID=A0A168JB65_9BACL|nr:hypothetical protein [Paenibacillus antarcticus]OAB40392.1 hypothetical protein PBAT_24140 [Paenibacillus antarcticus]